MRCCSILYSSLHGGPQRPGLFGCRRHLAGYEIDAAVAGVGRLRGVVSTPNPVPGSDRLSAVAAVSASDVWAVGIVSFSSPRVYPRRLRYGPLAAAAPSRTPPAIRCSLRWPATAGRPRPRRWKPEARDRSRRHQRQRLPAHRQPPEFKPYSCGLADATDGPVSPDAISGALVRGFPRRAPPAGKLPAVMPPARSGSPAALRRRVWRG